MIPKMEKQFRDMMGNDSIAFLGDVELVVKRREQASEIIEKIRGKITVDSQKTAKKNARLVMTERGLTEGKEKSRNSMVPSRQRAKSEMLPGIANSVPDKSLLPSDRVTVSAGTPYTTFSRPFEPKRFIPTLNKTRPNSGARNIIRSRVSSRKLNLSIEAKTVKSVSESPTKADKSVKYLVNDPLMISHEPSIEIFNKASQKAKVERKTSGTLEEYYMMNDSLQTNPNFLSGNLLGQEPSTRSASKKKPELLADPSPKALLSLLHTKKQKNVAEVFNQKLLKIRGNWMNRTYN